ncbi:hypothetical protein AC579_3610 [Pseudocercospora musae]|uniref:Uncharacterized protein n=1 Tax=Pseudocercospora musae TaxID=113226 RepID=A0A139IT17_9PEZI|nr:hypothetical protein AC579_3610 [Pseudocercospora musae]
MGIIRHVSSAIAPLRIMISQWRRVPLYFASPASLFTLSRAARRLLSPSVGAGIFDGLYG